MRERYAVFEHNHFEKYLVVLAMNEPLLDRFGDDVARTLDALLEKLASKSESTTAFNAFAAAVDQERPRVLAHLDLRDARAARRR